MLRLFLLRIYLVLFTAMWILTAFASFFFTLYPNEIPSGKPFVPIYETIVLLLAAFGFIICTIMIWQRKKKGMIGIISFQICLIVSLTMFHGFILSIFLQNLFFLGILLFLLYLNRDQIKS